MMTRFILPALILVASLSSPSLFAGWPKPLADITWLDTVDGKLVHTSGIMIENSIPGWEEVHKAIAVLNHVERPHITPEYLLWRNGATSIMAPARYLTSDELKQEMKAYFDGYANLNEQQKAAKKEAEEKAAEEYYANAKPWLQLIQVPRELPNGKSTPEDNCMATALIDGKYSGCGDVFQGGLQEDEIACYQNQNYVRCHLECLEKIRGKKLEHTVGSCK
jgi:hypothetical protein